MNKQLEINSMTFDQCRDVLKERMFSLWREECAGTNVPLGTCYISAAEHAFLKPEILAIVNRILSLVPAEANKPKYKLIEGASFSQARSGSLLDGKIRMLCTWSNTTVTGKFNGEPISSSNIILSDLNTWALTQNSFYRLSKEMVPVVQIPRTWADIAK